MLIKGQFEVIGYSVGFLENELLVDIKTVADETVTVTSGNYLAHYFDHVMAGSILFDIEEVDLTTFFVGHREQFEVYKSYAWPVWYDNTDELEKYLQENNYKSYVIISSLGLNGYVFAETLTIKRK
ncbi:hypothetical protein [Sporosarcina sp. FSL K6-3457]|uniref:hypothetical protein n=1 Tax=Sporosarcina sp. FSL K6-3457 TaxID=2978204 RepID=UPI0030F8671A